MERLVPSNSKLTGIASTENAMTDRDAQGALAGISVLEVGTGVAGTYCSKLFADMAPP